jgi:hypothetical protein
MAVLIATVCSASSCRRVLSRNSWPVHMTHVVSVATHGAHDGALQGALELRTLSLPSVCLSAPSNLVVPQLCTMARMGDAMRVIGRTFGGRQSTLPPFRIYPPHRASLL